MASDDGSGDPSYSHILARRRSFSDVATRVRVSAPKFIAQATAIAQTDRLNVDIAWEPIAWAIDIVLHTLDEQRAGRRSQSAGMPSSFFSAAYSINVTVAGRTVGGAEALYLRYRDEMKRRLVDSSLPAVQAKHGEAKLQEFRRQWEQHKVMSEFMRRFFDIVDRGYVANSAHLSLSAIALQLFKDVLFDADAKTEMVRAMLGIVARHRARGQTGSTALRGASASASALRAASFDEEGCRLLRQCSEIFYTLGVTAARGFNLLHHMVTVKRGQYVVPETLPLLPSEQVGEAAPKPIVVGEHLRVYRDDYERPLLVASLAHFKILADDAFARCTVVEYAKVVQRTLARERARVDAYFHSTTKEKLSKLVLLAMLAEPRQSELLRSPTSGLLRLLDAVVDEAAVLGCGARSEPGCGAHSEQGRPELGGRGAGGGEREGGGGSACAEGLRQSAKANISLLFGTVALIENGDAPWVRIDVVAPHATLQGGHKPMASIAGEWMQSRGLAFVEARKQRVMATPRLDTKDAVEMIDALASLHAVCKSLVHVEFQRRPVYIQSMRSAWERVVNPPSDLVGKFSMPQLLAAFFDTVLRGHKGKVRLSRAEQRRVCDAAIELWDYLSDKLLFIETYGELLMHRLLKATSTGRFVSDHALERSVIAQLKAKHAARYTTKLEMMFSDLEAGDGARRGFDAFVAARAGTGAAAEGAGGAALAKNGPICSGGLQVKLITRTAWPALPHSSSGVLALPARLDATRRAFHEYYREAHSGEKHALFHLPLCSVTITLTLPKCRALARMDTTQCAVLALFRSDRLVLTFAQLLNALRIDAEALQCALEVLTRKLQHCNGSLLLKFPKQSAILPLDKFKFNRKFQSKVAKLSLPFLSRADTAAAAERAYVEKEHCLRAAVVRTLKARGMITHRELVVEVTAQIKVFSAKTRDIKRTIEKLIEDKYLERHPNIEKTYCYLR